MIQLIVLIFVVGYLLIIFEKNIKIDKAVVALLMGVISWMIIGAEQLVGTESQTSDILFHHLADISSIIFFLLGAMTIVELIDLHNGFTVISNFINVGNKFLFLTVICLLTFFISAVLDNLTTTIVMISLTRKIIHSNEDRLWFASFIVISANSGGAWSPIGDVTTTMLWINHKVNSLTLIKLIFIPSILSIAIPLIIVYFYKQFKGNVKIDKASTLKPPLSAKFYLILGVSLLVMVPVFKAITHMPPFVGMILALGIIWLVSELELPDLYPRDRDYSKPTVRQALSKIEIPTILFFLGILLAISALESIGQLNNLSNILSSYFNDPSIIAFLLGLISSVIDNVPLVAAAIGMYSFPTDHAFWLEVAYAAGTGGSILIIGSAAGVIAMGIEKIKYSWYLKRISLLALCGYLGGWAYLLFIS